MSEQNEGAGHNILVVDDDAATLSVMKDALARRGYEVLSALSAEEAMPLIDMHDIDVIIADVMMPDEDGFAFLKAVRKRPDMSSVPFLFLTGDRTVASKVKGIELGVDDYLTKPCVMNELYARVAAMIRRRAASQAKNTAAGAPTEGWDLTGRLSAIPMSELLQTFEVNRKTGLIRIHTRYGEAEIYLENGVAAHATFAGIDGEEGVYLLFAVEDGTFDFRAGVQAPMKTITVNTQSLLLEGMRRQDETRAILAMRDEAMARAEAKKQAANQ